MALAALRATREAEARSGWQRLPCIVGVPLPGERLGRQVFDGTTEAAVFPGDLPADPAALKSGTPPGAVHFPRFRPPRLKPRGAGGRNAGLAAHPARPRHGFPAGRLARMNTEPRQPRAFTFGRSGSRHGAGAGDGGSNRRAEPPDTATLARPTFADLGRRGLRWGALLLAALAGAASLGVGRLVRAFRLGSARARRLGRYDHLRAVADCRLRGSDDRLARTDRLLAPGASRSPQEARSRRRSTNAIAKRERRAALRLAALYAGRRELAWGIKRFRDHARDVHDPGELLALADREILDIARTSMRAASSPGRPSASQP